MKMARIIAHIKFKHLNGKGGGKGRFIIIILSSSSFFFSSFFLYFSPSFFLFSIAPSLSRKDEGNIFRATSIAYKDDLKSLLSQVHHRYLIQHSFIYYSFSPPPPFHHHYYKTNNRKKINTTKSKKVKKLAPKSLRKNVPGL